jgi:transposase, IS5 family
MLRDRVASVDLFALVPALQLRFEPELAELDRLLEDDELFEHVKGRPESRSAAHDSNGAPIHTGRGHAAAAGGAAPVRLELCPDRALVGDSLVLRQFCRLGLQAVPHHTTLMRWSNLLQPETMHRLLDRVTELGRSLNVTAGGSCASTAPSSRPRSTTPLIARCCLTAYVCLAAWSDRRRLL